MSLFYTRPCRNGGSPDKGIETSLMAFCMCVFQVEMEVARTRALKHQYDLSYILDISVGRNGGSPDKGIETRKGHK